MENFVYMNRVNIKNQISFCFVIFSSATLNETLTTKNNEILPRTLQARPKSESYTPKRDDVHPGPFHIRYPPGNVVNM